MTALHNKALHQTRRGGVPAARAVVEARLAGEGWCCAGNSGRASSGMRLGPRAGVVRAVLLSTGLLGAIGCAREHVPQDSPTVSPQAAACVPTIVVADDNGVVWFGNEPHRPSRLVVALCKADLPLATEDRRRSLSQWLQATQGDPAQNPGSTLRICSKEGLSPAPADGLLAQARQHLPGLHDWCWAPGPANL